MNPSLLTWWKPKQQQSAIDKTRKQREFFQQDRFKRGLMSKADGVVSITKFRKVS